MQQVIRIIVGILFLFSPSQTDALITTLDVAEATYV